MNNLFTELSELFKANEGPEFRPSATKCAIAGSEWHFGLSIPSDLACFTGHFPGHPVFPGVIQVDWAAKIARHLFVALGEFKKMNNVKFSSMILPGMHLTLLLAYDKDKRQVKFSYFSEQATFSSGILVYS